MLLSRQCNETEKKMIPKKIRKLNDKFSQLESETVVAKQAHSLLSKRLVDMKRQCWANTQYSRRECIEVVGIPNSADNSEVS